MNYTNINERLDLDNQIKQIAKDFPRNEDDYFVFIRGKNSTNELFFASVMEGYNLGHSLFQLALQNENVCHELENAFTALQGWKKNNKNEHLTNKSI